MNKGSKAASTTSHRARAFCADARWQNLYDIMDGCFCPSQHKLFLVCKYIGRSCLFEGFFTYECVDPFFRILSRFLQPSGNTYIRLRMQNRRTSGGCKFNSKSDSLTKCPYRDEGKPGGDANARCNAHATQRSRFRNSICSNKLAVKFNPDTFAIQISHPVCRRSFRRPKIKADNGSKKPFRHTHCLNCKLWFAELSVC